MANAVARWAQRDLTLRGATAAGTAALVAVGLLRGTDGSLGGSFSISLIALGITLALAVEAGNRLNASLAPAVLLGAALAVLVVVDRDGVDVSGLSPNVNVVGHWLAAVVDHGVALACACGAAAAVSVLRARS